MEPKEKRYKLPKKMSPPSQLFLNQEERNFQKNIADELVEYVIGQTILYYPIDPVNTKYHEIYGEAIDKVFLPPIKVNVFVDFEDNDTKTGKYGPDRRSKITVHFHKRRLNQEQDLHVKEGDFIYYNDEFHEIVKLSENDELYGDIQFKVAITATCVKSRQSNFFPVYKI
jgi:hypothetical protein